MCEMRPIMTSVQRLQRLAVFDAVARNGSFSAGAQELGLTQPVVTRQMRDLEAALGIELFERSKNRSRLTAAGAELAAAVDSSLASIEHHITRLSVDSTPFVLAAHPGIAQQWLVPRIDEIHRALGGRDLRLWLFDHDDELRSGSFDASIRVGTGAFASQDSIPLFAEEVAPVASPAFAEAHGLSAQSHPSELTRLLHMDQGNRPWMTWSDWATALGAEPPARPTVVYNNYPLVLQEAVAGRGVALGWRRLVDDMLAQGVLVEVGAWVKHATSGYHLTWHPNRRTANVDGLAAWLQARLGNPE